VGNWWLRDVAVVIDFEAEAAGRGAGSGAIGTWLGGALGLVAERAGGLADGL